MQWRSASPIRPRGRSDLLVCADGVGSTARARLLPEVQPVYSGYVAWRGMISRGLAGPGHSRSGRRRHHLLRLREQPHPRLPDTRAVRFGGARRTADQLRLVPQLPRGQRSRRSCSPIDVRPTSRHVAVRPARPASITSRNCARSQQSRLPEPIARVVLRHRAAVPAGCLRYRGAAHGLRTRLPHRRRRVRCARPHAAAGTAKAAADAWALADAIDAASRRSDRPRTMGTGATRARATTSRSHAPQRTPLAVRRHLGSRRPGI